VRAARPTPTVYDVVFAEDGTDGHAFGRPAGITQLQWPRSRVTGLPLSYLFTVNAPAQYRPDPDQVALSLFQADDHVEKRVDGVAEVIDGGRPPAEPTEPELLAAVSRYAANRHPMERYVLDEIGGGWAILWLTAAEAAGPLCELPDGFTERAIHEVYGSYPPQYVRAADQPQRALKLVVREGDPNAGRAMTGDPSYLKRYTTEWDELDLPGFGSCHFGGTVDYVNGEPPDFGIWYLEFNESLGWPNLGGGNALIDLPTDRLFWSC
jgi:hypothetical protein